MRTYSLQLTASTETRLTVFGRYFRIIEATGEIQARIDQDQPADMQQGIGVRLLDGFSELAFTSATAQTIKVAVSPYDIDDNRLSVPDGIAVSTRRRNLSADGNSYHAGASQNGVAGQYLNNMLKNATDSVNNIIVTRIQYWVANGTMNVRHNSHAATKATLAAFAIPFGGNKQVDLPADDECLLHYISKATQDGTFYSNLSCDATANAPQTILLEEHPFIIKPGYYLNLCPSLPNQNTAVFFEYYKDPV